MDTHLVPHYAERREFLGQLYVFFPGFPARPLLYLFCLEFCVLIYALKYVRIFVPGYDGMKLFALHNSAGKKEKRRRLLSRRGNNFRARIREHRESFGYKNKDIIEYIIE